MRARRLLAVAAAGALLLGACGSDDDTDEETTDTTEAPGVTVERDDGEGEAEDEVSIEPMEIDTTVRYAGFEYDVQTLEVDDSSGMGLMLTFDVSVENTTSDTSTPNPEVMLLWDDGDDVVSLRVNTNFREVPGESSSRGEMSVQVTSDDLETYDEDTARLTFGRTSQAQAIVALGDDVDTVDRLPVVQDLEGGWDSAAGFEVTITSAEVRWDTPNRQQLDEGSALLIFEVDVTNDAENQVCARRGDWEITLPDGTRRTADGTSENCYSAGEDERGVIIGFEIDDPFEGDYDIVMAASGAGNDYEAIFEFSLSGESAAAVEAAEDDDSDDDDDSSDDDDSDEDDESDDDES
ncbi:MAG: hypothetical protein JJU45_18345 [Acidimicrobiia bacterium]|nr:hypothetical protein [Acidimicrobiia bacterium]